MSELVTIERSELKTLLTVVFNKGISQEQGRVASIAAGMPEDIINDSTTAPEMVEWIVDGYIDVNFKKN